MGFDLLPTSYMQSVSLRATAYVSGPASLVKSPKLRLTFNGAYRVQVYHAKAWSSGMLRSTNNAVCRVHAGHVVCRLVASLCQLRVTSHGACRVHGDHTVWRLARSSGRVRSPWGFLGVEARGMVKVSWYCCCMAVLSPKVDLYNGQAMILASCAVDSVTYSMPIFHKGQVGTGLSSSL